MRQVVVLALILGAAVQAQPTAPKYPFSQPPLTILAGLADLKVGEIPDLDATEAKFLKDVWDDRSQARTPTAGTDPRLLEAALIACGARTAAESQDRKAKFEAIVTAAKQATADAKTPAERGEALMKHLHATVLKGGYDAKQSALTSLMDTGKYNCVSSSLLYYLVGSRLDLKLQPIAIPGGLFLDGHVALDLLEGTTRIQVEPTGPDGFDYAVKIKRPGVVIWGPRPDRNKAIDIDALGLVAAQYSNQGVEHSKAEPPRYPEAARAYLCALALDPPNRTATNLVGVFINWGPAMQKAGKHAEAVRVLQFGRSLDRDNRDLRENLEIVWSRYIDAQLAEGKDAEAINMVGLALKDLPLARAFQNPARSFERYGLTVYEDKGPEAALAVAERGLKLVQGKDAQELREWRNGIFRRWSQQLLDKKDLDGSLKVMSQAYALDKTSRDIEEGIAYHLQEALKKADAAGGAEAAGKEFTRVTAAFPDHKELAEVAESFVQRGIRELTQQKKYPEAIQRVTDYAGLLPKAEQRADAGALVYDLWARSIADEKKWEAALDKYGEGLKAYPKHARLVNNAAVVVDRWADAPYQAKMYDEAIRIYQIGLKLLPDHPGLKYNLKICQERKGGK